MASFRAKICWGRLRKRENKKNRFDEFLPESQLKIPKKKKIQKIKKNHYGFFSTQNKLGKADKEKEKKNRSDELLPDP